MEATEGAHPRERGKRDSDPSPAEASGAGDTRRGPPLSGTSYWLDLWLFLLFDLVLFVFIYLLP